MLIKKILNDYLFEVKKLKFQTTSKIYVSVPPNAGGTEAGAAAAAGHHESEQVFLLIY